MAEQVQQLVVEIYEDALSRSARVRGHIAVGGRNVDINQAPLALLRAVFEDHKKQMLDRRGEFFHKMHKLRVATQQTPDATSAFDELLSRLFGTMLMCETALQRARPEFAPPQAPVDLAAAAQMAAQDRELLSLLNFILRECRIMRGDVPGLTNHRERSRIMDAILRGCDGIRQRVAGLMTKLWGEETIDATENTKLGGS